MSFFEDLLEPKGRVETKLAQYEKEGKIDKYCTIMSVALFLLVALPSALFMPGLYGVMFAAISGLGFVGGYWFGNYILSTACKWFGGNHSVKKLVLSSLTVWPQILVMTIAVSLISVLGVLALGEMAFLVSLPLTIFGYIRYGLGIIAGSQGVTYSKAFFAQIVSMLILLVVSIAVNMLILLV